MSEWGRLDGDGVLDDVAAALIDSAGKVIAWSAAAADLTNCSAHEVCGRWLDEFLAEGNSGNLPASGTLRLRRLGSDAVAVHYRVLPLESCGNRLFLAVRVDVSKRFEQGSALIRSLLAQDQIGFIIRRGTDLAVESANVFPGMSFCPIGSTLTEVMSPQDARSVEKELRAVLATGEPQVAREGRVRPLIEPASEWSFLVSAVRLEDRHGKPAGVTILLTDATERWRSARRTELQHRAAAGIGDTLNVATTAQQITDVLVPDFADLVTVDLAEPVLVGDEPPRTFGGGDLYLYRAAMCCIDELDTSGLLSVGERVPSLPDLPLVRQFQVGHTVVLDQAQVKQGLGDPGMIRLLIPDRARSLAVAPLFARGVILGTIAAWRTDRTEPFNTADADLLTEIAAHAALSVDNARRYTREHRAAVSLQQSLLPKATSRTSAIETVGSYVPASGTAGVSGDWFDTIQLPSLRVALVIGDVIGHGLPAAATMGRLRTAVHTLADLELPPDEVLARLDELVARLAAEADPAHRDVVGATCLYALYDPITRECTMASAGHPPPLLMRQDGIAHPLSLDPGPPLGVGGLPFEAATVLLEPGSTLCLYTDGLLMRQSKDLDTAIQHLARDLTEAATTTNSLEDMSRTLTPDPAASPESDDAALLLARIRALRSDTTAEWHFSAEPASVAKARTAATTQLADWGLETLAFTTELIISELVTNAIRYAGGPIRLRLIRDTTLVCEVSDPSNTHPRLRHARLTDEGGRGLFLVAQLSHRWGSRYGASGKTIWAEQQFSPTE
ncbi:ATP-binding SpoIIE family protein phosphatase [Streptomyces cinereoruber]|uniref:ATP-binding SpoIIE family protein phosphatase n=1 Tax=Streptomyces cinereoruber TaxID=67260 RepID=UPI00362DDF78